MNIAGCYETHRTETRCASYSVLTVLSDKHVCEININTVFEDFLTPSEEKYKEGGMLRKRSQPMYLHRVWESTVSPSPDIHRCQEIRAYTHFANINILLRTIETTFILLWLDNRRRTLCDLAHGREQAFKEGPASWLAVGRL